jgi:hypothetical protein
MSMPAPLLPLIKFDSMTVLFKLPNIRMPFDPFGRAVRPSGLVPMLFKATTTLSASFSNLMPSNTLPEITLPRINELSVRMTRPVPLPLPVLPTRSVPM